MKKLFDEVSYKASKITTQTYSTSFSFGILALHKSIRKSIYNIYGFVRFADEIVDTFHGFDKELLLQKFEEDLAHALEHKISLNPILNSFQYSVHENNIQPELIEAFLKKVPMALEAASEETQSSG